MMEAEKKPFEVTDEASAEWALEKMGENAAARRVIEEQYARMLARHEKWREDMLKELDESDQYLSSLLRPWAAEKLAGGKKKSVKLPSGRVGFRAGTKTFTMGGEQVTGASPALLAFVKAADVSYIETRESVRWGNYKKTLIVTEDGRAVTANGEIVEGMTVTQGEPSFYVEVEQ